MVEVEGKTAGQVEERMVGIDLSKGVIMEIQLTTGKTCAKHKLGMYTVQQLLRLYFWKTI